MHGRRPCNLRLLGFGALGQQEKNYRQYRTLAEEMVLHTNTGSAPWTLVEGNCRRWAEIKVMTQVAVTLTEALDRLQGADTVPSLPPQTQLELTEPNLLAEVDLSCQISAERIQKTVQARTG